MSATAPQRDQATAKALGWVALCLIVGWTGVGLLDGVFRLVDTLRLRDALRHGRSWDPVIPLGAELLLGMLWTVALAALALGVAVAVAALVLRGRTLRGVLLAALAVIGCAAEVAFINRTAGGAWSFSGSTRMDSAPYAAVGVVVVPIVVLAVACVLLGPALRTPRSTPARAAAG